MACHPPPPFATFPVHRRTARRPGAPILDIDPAGPRRVPSTHSQRPPTSATTDRGRRLASSSEEDAHETDSVALATLCLLAGQTIFAGAASGADPSKFTATPLTPDSTFVGAKSSSGAIAQSDPALLGRTDATPVNVMIKYDYDATASYAGGVDGLAATSPRVTGKSLKANAAAVQAYDAYTAEPVGRDHRGRPEGRARA